MELLVEQGFMQGALFAGILNLGTVPVLPSLYEVWGDLNQCIHRNWLYIKCRGLSLENVFQINILIYTFIKRSTVYSVYKINEFYWLAVILSEKVRQCKLKLKM